MKTEIFFLQQDKANEAFKESEERYRRLLAATTDYIYTVNLEHGETRSTSHGPGCEAVTGYSVADFTREPFLWYRIIHETDRPAVLQQVDRILKGELPPPLEHRIIRRDGGLRWIRNTTIPHRDSSGKLVGYDGLIKDITEGKLAKEALQDERNLLRTLVDNLPDCIFAKDISGSFSMLNLAHARALGAANVEEVLGKTDSDFLPATQAAQNRLAEERVSRSGHPLYNVEESFVDSTGNRRWFSTTRVPLKDPSGAVVGLVGIKHDVTARKWAEQAIRESQERLALVIRGSNDGIWDWNIATNEAFFSTRWKSMLGYMDEEIENHFSAYEELIHPDDRELARERVRAYLAGETGAFELEHRLRHKNGSYRWILARGVMQRDSDGRPVRMVGSHMDFTELKTAAENLRKTNAELLETQGMLIQAARFESMGTLAAGVAHQVKNPLQTILMGLHHLSGTDTVKDAEVLLTLGDMHEAVSRADSIISELLEYSRFTEFDLAPGNLNQVLQRCLQLIKAKLDAARVTPEVNLAADLPMTLMHVMKLQEVFLNLLLNAIQAMHSGGKLTITTRTLTLDGDPAAIPPLFRRFAPGQRLVVGEIRDSGGGIRPELLSRVFDPFFTTKPVGVGTGLGLFVARMIVQSHGGVIYLDNAPGGGAVATIALKAEREGCP